MGDEYNVVADGKIGRRTFHNTVPRHSPSCYGS